MTGTRTGWNPDGVPGADFDPVAAGHYIIEPPVFETEAKQRDTGPMWVGHCKIVECVTGATSEIGNELAVFMYDPMYSIEALGGLRTILARHGLSPGGLPLGDMASLVEQVNQLVLYGENAHILVSDEGYVQNHRFTTVNGQTNVLVVFEDFAYFDLAQWAEEGGRYTYRVEPSKKFVDKKGKPRLNYRCDVLLRIVSDGPWQGHIGSYSFLNYTLAAYFGEGNVPMVGPAAGGKKKDTNFTRWMQTVGITNVVEQVFAPGGEALDARVIEAAKGNGRPHILEWIKDAALVMRHHGHVMSVVVDAAKGYLQAKNMQVAGPAQIKAIGMPDAIPTLLTFEDAQASGPPKRQAVAPAVTASSTQPTGGLLPLADVAAAYNTWAQAKFGVPVFQMVEGRAGPVKEHEGPEGKVNPVTNVLLPYVLPVLLYGASDEESAGLLGISRKAPCRMDAKQLAKLVAVLNDDEYLKATNEGEGGVAEAIIKGHLGSEPSDDDGF
jgi:hypothetical protein